MATWLFLILFQPVAWLLWMIVWSRLDGYRGFWDWWYNEIDKRPESGGWYYGATHRRRKCHHWDSFRKD